MSKEPKGKELAIQILADEHSLLISAITSRAQDFVLEDSIKYGSLRQDSWGEGQYVLKVYINYNLQEVKEYLLEQFDELNESPFVKEFFQKPQKD